MCTKKNEWIKMLHPYWFPHDQLHVILNPWRHGTVLWCQQPMNLYMIIVYHFTPRKQQLNIRQQSLLNCVISLLSFLVTIPSLLYGKWWTEFVVTHFYHMAANMYISFFKMCRSIMWSLVTAHAGLVIRQRMSGFL